MSYNVVFEYTVKAGGYAGIRFIVSYQNEEEFMRMNPPESHEHTSIIAKDVCEDDAQDLISLNPEVCHLTAAIQEMCYADDGHVDIKITSYHLQKAKYAITQDRKQRQLFAIRKGSLATDFPFVEIGTEETDRNKLYRFIKENFTSPEGSIGDIDTAILLILSKIINIYKLPPSVC